jgi:hypothetical protein
MSLVSPEFLRFAQVHAGVSTWNSTDAEWARALDTPFQEVSAYYATYPKLAWNMNGDEWLVEAHYVSSFDHPNAFVGRMQKGFGIAVSITTFVYFDILTKKLFCDPQLFSQFGRPDSSDARVQCYKNQLGDFFADIGPVVTGELPKGLSLHDPSDPERKSLVRFLRDLMIRYLLHHEFGHILFGHVGTSETLYGRAVMSEVGVPSPGLGLEESVRMELCADYHAVVPAVELLFQLYKAHGTAQLTPGTRIDDWFAVALLAVTLVNSLWCIIDFTMRGAMEDAFLADTHPPSVARLIVGATGGMGAMKLLGVQAEVISASIEKFKSNLKYVIENYAILNVVGALLNRHQSGLSLYNTAAENASLKDERWNKYSFFKDDHEGE